MKTLNLICLLLAICVVTNGKILNKRHGIPPAGTPNTRARAPLWGTIEQRLDHFSPADDRTWEMRYMYNDQFYEEGGPMFIMLGGEWEISAGYLVTGQMFDMAEQHKGYMYYTEHRYYGTSYPLEDFSSENLEYLNVDQALADVAYFITQKRLEVPGMENSKVVVVGGSYAGNMAAWARLKYPHLITAALASSAPLHAIEDFYQYLEVVSTSIGLVDEKCLSTIEEGTAAMEDALEDEDTKSELEELLQTCLPIRTDEPYRSYFFSSITGLFSGLVQYAQTGAIEYDCNTLLGFDGTPMEQLANYIRTYYGNECVGDYDEFLGIYQNNETTRDAYRQWLYQTCTEYGYYQTTTSNDQPFGHTVLLELNHEMCKDLYGEDYTVERLQRGVERTNIIYGSITPDVTKVVFTHGTVDPWHSIGVLEDLSELAPAIVVEGASHCADLSSISSLDSPQMQEAKKRVLELIAEWLE